MGYKLLHGPTFKSGSVEKKRKKTVETIYRLDSADDVDAFLATRKKQGGTVVFRRGIYSYYYSIDSISVDRRPPLRDGGLQIAETMTLSTLTRAKGPTPPWELSPYNYRDGASLVEESTAQFYPGVGDPIFPNGVNDGVARDFVNTAGVMLEGSATRSLFSFSFSYNLPAEVEASRFWRAVGKVNASTITVCGMTFGPRELKIEKLDRTFCTTDDEVTDVNGTVTKIVWKYWRVDAEFLADPRTFDQRFLNVGTHVNVDGALYRIWRWTDPATLAPRFGTYYQYLGSGATDGEALSENVALSIDGTGVSPLDATGRQVMTHRIGSPFQPASFSGLRLPKTGAAEWEIVDEEE